MDHWKTLGELVEAFYLMMHYEQKERISAKYSERTIFSTFANIRDSFDDAVLNFLEKNHFSLMDTSELKLLSCKKC